MTQIPRFFYNGPLVENRNVILDADTAKHIWQVLRMGTDDRVVLTDGNGNSADGRIYLAERHACTVSVEKTAFHPRQGNQLHLCVGFTKNNSRNEWLLEKATELGVASIVPVAAFRSEKTYVRNDRWNKILQSAILQSQQNYLPRLADVTPIHMVLQQYRDTDQKLVAHCVPGENKRPLSEMLKTALDTVLLIGPEGDFTKEEVILCTEHGFEPVSLGAQRLRTETAAIMAAAYCKVINDAKN